MKLLFTTLAFLLYVVQSGFAQDSIVDQDVKVNQQLWLDYNDHKPLGENKGLSTQIGFRRIEPKVYNRFLVNSTLYFKNKKSPKLLHLKKPFIDSYHLGAGLFYTQNYDADDNFEFRLMQGLKFHVPTIKALTFYNYVRLEERFQNTFDGSGWSMGMRLRYRLSTQLNWGDYLFDFTRGLYFPLNAEVFFNLVKSDRYNDLVRISPGIGYRTDSNWKFEMYVIFNRTKNITETNNKSSDFILRIRIINATKKKYSAAEQEEIPLEEGE